MQRSKRTTISELNDFPRLILAGTDPILFLGEGTAPRNDVTDRCGKQIFLRGLHQPRSQGLSSLPPLVVGRPKKAEKRDPGNEVGGAPLRNDGTDR